MPDRNCNSTRRFEDFVPKANAEIRIDSNLLDSVWYVEHGDDGILVRPPESGRHRYSASLTCAMREGELSSVVDGGYKKLSRQDLNDLEVIYNAYAAHDLFDDLLENRE